jgi:hypothetical protein
MYVCWFIIATLLVPICCSITLVMRRSAFVRNPRLIKKSVIYRYLILAFIFWVRLRSARLRSAADVSTMDKETTEPKTDAEVDADQPTQDNAGEAAKRKGSRLKAIVPHLRVVTSLLVIDLALVSGVLILLWWLSGTTQGQEIVNRFRLRDVYFEIAFAAVLAIMVSFAVFLYSIRQEGKLERQLVRMRNLNGAFLESIDKDLDSVLSLSSDIGDTENG